APAGAPRRHHGALGSRRDRATPHVLPPHPCRPEAARRGAPPVAGGRCDTARHLAVDHRRTLPRPDPIHLPRAGSLTMSDTHAVLEEQIAQWRTYLQRRQAIHAVDVAELEDHLREQVAGLTEGGLAADEAFLVAVKRMGNLDALSREFAREHSERLWKQLVVAPAEPGAAGAVGRSDLGVAFGVAVLVGIVIKIAILLRLTHGQYVRDASLPLPATRTARSGWAPPGARPTARRRLRRGRAGRDRHQDRHPAPAHRWPVCPPRLAPRAADAHRLLRLEAGALRPDRRAPRRRVRGGRGVRERLPLRGRWLDRGA